MNKAQWKAIKDICEEFGCTQKELLQELKENGTVGKATHIEELNEYVSGDTYDDMLKFLADNL